MTYVEQEISNTLERDVGLNEGRNDVERSLDVYAQHIEHCTP